MVSKAEQRERKAQKQQAAKRREKLLSVVTRTSIVVITVLALYVFYQGIFGGMPSVPPGQLTEFDHVRGDPDTPLNITIYADFQCPSCATEMQLVARSWSQIQDRAHLVFRHFPLDIHRHAFMAARYAEAAGRQGEFWAMHDALFSNQQVWSGLDDATELFDSFARQLGLDMQQLQQDLVDPELRDKINADQQGGIRARVRATPTMFFNGREVSTPRTASEFRSMVDEAVGSGAE